MKTKTMVLFLCAVLFFVFTACSSVNSTSGSDTSDEILEEQQKQKSSDKSKQKEDEEISEIVKTKVTFTVTHQLEGLKELVTEYMKKNNDVEIIIEEIDDYEKYETQLATKIMAGEAGDLFFNDKRTAMYYENELYVDFNELMDSDTSFDKNDYFTNVFEANEQNGKLYEFPIAIDFEIVGANTVLPKDIIDEFNSEETISIDKVVDLYERSVNEIGQLKDSENTQTYYVEQNYDFYRHLVYSRSDFIDNENKTCNFNSPEFLSFIETRKKFSEPNKNMGFYYTYTSNVYNQEKDADLASKFLFNISANYNIQNLFDHEDLKYFRGYKALTDSDGKVAFTPTVFCSLLKTSKNKEICWDFIKFMNSPEVYETEKVKTTYYRELPLYFHTNKALYDLYVRRETLDRLRSVRSSGKNVSSKQLIDDACESYTKIMEMPFVNNSRGLEFIDRGSLESFYKGLISAEQAATEMQNYATLVFME